MTKSKHEHVEALDVTTIAADEREALIRVGRELGSGATLRQADLTLKAYAKFPQVAEYGFGDEDAQMLTSARTQLEEKGATRDDARHGQKVTRDEWHAAMRQAKASIRTARTVLANTAGALARRVDTNAVTVVREIKATLTETAGGVGDDLVRAKHHVTALSTRLADAAVARAAAGRGGPRCATSLAAAKRALEGEETSAPKQGTVSETSAMDLLDGIIAREARAARKAARECARETGDESIAAAFALTELRLGRRATKKSDGSGTVGGSANPAG